MGNSFHFTMKVICFLVLVLASIDARDFECGPGSTKTSVTVNAGDSFTYKTQKGVKYMGNTDCTVNYKLGDSCDRMSFICNKVNIESTDQNCNNGDSLVVSSKAKEKRICKKKKLRVVSDQDLTAVFTSDSTGHSTGAECKAVCSGSGTQFTVINNTGSRINALLRFIPGSCSDNNPSLFFIGIARDGFITYGDPQPSCFLKGNGLTAIIRVGRRRVTCTITPREQGLCTTINTFVVNFKQPANCEVVCKTP